MPPCAPSCRLARHFAERNGASRRVTGYRRNVPDSISITDNRTGDQLEIPIVNGGVSSADWRKLLPDVMFYDPGFMATAACESAITELDGEAGILRYRGYPIEQLAEKSTYLEVSYLLLHGDLPTKDQYTAGSTTSRTTPTSTRTCASGSWTASTTTPIRWACWSRPSLRCRPSISMPRRSTTRRSATSRSSASSPRCRRWPRVATGSARACRSCIPTTTSASPRTS